MPLPLFALFAAAFSVGTTELIVTGLLPAVAANLAVDIPTAGFLVTGYATGVAIGGPLLALATGRVPRRALLLTMMVLFVTGNVLCALATSYWLLMGARLVVACSHGLFFGVALVIATGLVAKERQASAVSLVVAGITFANVVGVPIGTAIGNAFGWRMTFWFIAALGVAATVALAILVPHAPKIEKAEAVSAGDEIRVLGQAPVLLSYAIITLAMTAFLAPFTYIVPMLTKVTGVSIAWVPWLLFVSGVGGILGNLAGGRLGDWKPMPALIAIFSIELVLYFVGLAAVYDPLAMTVVFFLWSLVGFSFPAIVQTRILRAVRAAPNLASTLISTAFNTGIAAGAFLGGVALNHQWTYGQLPWISIVFLGGALAVTGLLLAYDRRRPAVA